MVGKPFLSLLPGLLMKLCIAFSLLVPAVASAKGFFAVVTKEPAALIPWYEQAFDARLVRTMKPEGRGITIYVLDASHVTIEIQHRTDAIQHLERANARQGIMKASFSVMTIEPWLERWRAMKARIVAGPFDDTEPKMRSVVLLDPDGNSIHVTASPTSVEAVFAAHINAIKKRDLIALERTITNRERLTLNIA